MSDPLAKFGRWCLTEMNSGNGDKFIDGTSAREEATSLGLLSYIEIDEPCCDNCWCQDYYAADEWPVQCLRETPLAKTLEEKP